LDICFTTKINCDYQLHNSRFCDFVDRIYPIKLEIKDITNTYRYASYLDLRLEIDSEGRLRTNLIDKRDDFNFPIVNFPFIYSNIPAAPVYEVYMSQLIQYSRVCGSYQDFLDRGLLLTRKGSYWTKGSYWLSWSHHFESITVATMTVMEYLCHKWPRICCTCRKRFPVLSAFLTFHRICCYINTTGATSVAGSAYPSGAPEFIPFLSGVRVTWSLVLCVCFVDICRLFCPFSFDYCVVCRFQILITPFVVLEITYFFQFSMIVCEKHRFNHNSPFCTNAIVVDFRYVISDGSLVLKQVQYLCCNFVDV
jgi:hypothetical protein